MEYLHLEVNGKKAQVELFKDEAPETITKLQSILPQKIELHYAKFAGEEVFGIVPLLMPLEKKTNVNNLTKGAVVYYPERQLFCVYYGELQEEDCNVTVIGRLISTEVFNLEMEKARYHQGIPMTITNWDGEAFIHGAPKGFPATPDFLWDKPPAEIHDLIYREGVMQPGGPTIYAEAETRKLAEILWAYRQVFIGNQEDSRLLMEKILCLSINRIGGWCGLKDCAAVIGQYLERLKTESNKLAVLDALILYTNRLNMWLDLLIPWDTCNEAIIKYNRN